MARSGAFKITINGSLGIEFTGPVGFVSLSPEQPNDANNPNRPMKSIHLLE
jgi:hypothetical protein